MLLSVTNHPSLLQIINAKQFHSKATRKTISLNATNWGKRNESVALEKFKLAQYDSGHHGLYYCPSGFIISDKYPYLGASPDAVVHDPTEANPFAGEVSVFTSHLQAAESKDF